MTGDEYNWCLTVFFFTYAAFEVPSNLLLKKLRPSVWLPAIMVAWGIVMTLMGIVKNYHGLLIVRTFLGVTEAGLFPGVAVNYFHPYTILIAKLTITRSTISRCGIAVTKSNFAKRYSSLQLLLRVPSAVCLLLQLLKWMGLVD